MKQTSSSNMFASKPGVLDKAEKAIFAESPTKPEPEFIVNYNGEFTPKAQRAFQRAVDDWAEVLDIKVPIVIDANFINITREGLGFIPFGGGRPNATPQKLKGLSGKVRVPNALANQLAGSDLNKGEADIDIVLNSDPAAKFSFDGNPSSDEADFRYIVAHEIIHGLGAVSQTLVPGEGEEGAGRGFLGVEEPGVPDLFDLFVETGNGKKLTDFKNGSEGLAKAIQSDNLFFDGANVDLPELGIGGGNTNSANGKPAKLFAPKDFRRGSSVAHLDERTFIGGDEDALFSPFFDFGETFKGIGSVIQGLVADLGYNLAVTNQTAEIQAQLDGKTLNINDTNANSNENLTLLKQGKFLSIGDPNNSIIAGTGLLQPNNNRVDVSLDSVKKIAINTKGGDDTVDASGLTIGAAITGGDGNDDLFGTQAADSIVGGNGNDSLRGGRGDDTLAGGAGVNVYDGGKGSDILNGGEGTDRFVLRKGDGADTIFNYTDGKDNFLLADLKFSELSFSQGSNGNVTIALDKTDEVLATVIGANANSLRSSDFSRLT